MGRAADEVEALRARLSEAHAALAAGESDEAERRAKAICALVRAEREVAELAAARAPSQEEDEDALRAELRRRMVLFADADRQGADAVALERIAATGVSE